MPHRIKIISTAAVMRSMTSIPNNCEAGMG